ncbi:[protein-PII] uridylyltransferase [Comamonas serinivorans]|uniref:Bifunctional uridylyltransferase/uridylyl-removing enzyme n=1 Tax=Comamonas serinivorans TaxID=1082851 RepID=A0A1Y0EL44_9BURK|nr:[protein-PII] uridylyltransferase [Comamonas serinivorans]ARU04032.1 [protein-PII] uridylyltransferase [Comamonas serinivorans]
MASSSGPAAPPAVSPPPPPQAREQYLSRKQALFEQVLKAGASTRGLQASLQALSGLTDDALRQLWHWADLPGNWTLLAVGGFGRGELFPHSDVDVLILLPDDVDHPDAAQQAQLEHFISGCWDTGLEIGSSVRTVAQCVSLANEDLTIQTAMLEARLIVGNPALFEAFTHGVRGATDPAAFFVAKVLEMRQRHQKYEDTPYALEPNVKESPGGLRDLQVIRWVAGAAGLGDSWEALAANGVATVRESTLLQRHERLLGLIRARLHLLAKRREDRLVFDMQTPLAETFGYANSFNAEGRLALRASETLMRRYYWSAKAVAQLNQILLQGIEERLRVAKGLPEPQPNPINARFVERAGLLDLVDDELYQRDPHAILDTFLTFEQAVGVSGLSARVLRALFNARTQMNSAFRCDPVNRATFLAILQQPQGITHAMRLMNQTSVLGRYLWVFRRIVGQMQHDLFHVYTVDQHILMVLRNMRRFFMAEHAHEYPFCSQLAAGWDKPWLLYTAALFHDIAKGRGGDHSELGAMEVRRFCRAHGVAEADTELLEFLVREHLTMSQTAQKQDLSDPEVITTFAERVGNERRLTALYLLTVADIRGTSPKVWNAWRGKLLEDLYRATARVLGGNVPDASALVEATKREALVLLARGSQPHQAERALWSTLDVSYFMRHDPGEIAWHTRQISRYLNHQPDPQDAATRVLVRARLSPIGEGLQVLLYTPDRIDLFARACGYFDRSSLSIVDARIYTTRDGHALDTFQVITEEQPEHYRELINLVENGLAKALSTPALPEPRTGRVSRRVRSFPILPRLDLRPDEKAQRWLLTVSASDRVGLLYAIARVFASYGINVQLAKILTLGERAEDSFLIEGAALQDSRTQLALERDLLKVLGQP